MTSSRDPIFSFTWAPSQISGKYKTYINKRSTAGFCEAVGYQRGEGGSGPSTFLKYDPRDLSKIVKNLSRRSFPRICKSLRGMTQKIFGTTPPDSPLLEPWIRLCCEVRYQQVVCSMESQRVHSYLL